MGLNEGCGRCDNGERRLRVLQNQPNLECLPDHMKPHERYFTHTCANASGVLTTRAQALMISMFLSIRLAVNHSTELSLANELNNKISFDGILIRGFPQNPGHCFATRFQLTVFIQGTCASVCLCVFLGTHVMMVCHFLVFVV